MLPAGLRSWAFLPKWMKSLEPLDRVVCGPLGKVFALCACKCCKKAATKPEGQMSTHDIEVAAQRLGATASNRRHGRRLKRRSVRSRSPRRFFDLYILSP